MNTEDKKVYNISPPIGGMRFPHHEEMPFSERRCKGRGIKIESPANFADPAKNLLIFTNIANFTLRNIRTHYHFATMVIRKFLVHHVAPFADKFPFEVTE